MTFNSQMIFSDVLCWSLAFPNDLVLPFSHVKCEYVAPEHNNAKQASMLRDIVEMQNMLKMINAFSSLTDFSFIL